MMMIKHFKLGIKKYTVKEVSHDSENLGRCIPPLGVIEIQKMFFGKKIPEEEKEQILYHEVIHCICDDIGRPDVSEDESFVQSFSVLLAQFMATRK